MRKILFLIFILLSSSILFAQEEDDFFSDDIDFEDMDLDSMFSDEEEFIEEVEDKSDEVAEPSSELLTTEGVEWGGSFSSSLAAGLTYNKFNSFDNLWDDDKHEETFTPSLDASLHFNARPKENLRFYGKFTTSIPFYNSANVLIANDGYDPISAANYDPTANPFSTSHREGNEYKVGIPDITIYELFNDFNYENKLFFRVGKQNAKWGVGYFFSPADFLSLESIDPENPDADREGPIAIKMSMPFGLNNLYTYISVPKSIFDDLDDASISDLIVAPMYQMLIGDTEVSTGIYFQKDNAKRAMVSATYATNTNFGEFSFFGEAVGMYGSDKNFIKEDYILEKKDDEFFFNGTVGFRWNKKILENEFSFAGQYLFNGEGYDKKDSEVVKEVMTGLSGDTSGISEDNLVNYIAFADSDLSANDLTNRHKHYIGASFGINNLFDNEDLSFNTFTMMNLVDVSGFIKPSISYSFFDDLSTSLGATINLSDEGDEYYADKFAFEITVILGGGSF